MAANGDKDEELVDDEADGTDDKDEDPFTGCEAIIREEDDEDSQNDDDGGDSQHSKSRRPQRQKRGPGLNKKDRHTKNGKVPEKKESAATNSNKKYAIDDVEHLFPPGVVGSSSKVGSNGKHHT